MFKTNPKIAALFLLSTDKTLKLETMPANHTNNIIGGIQNLGIFKKSKIANIENSIIKIIGEAIEAVIISPFSNVVNKTIANIKPVVKKYKYRRIKMQFNPTPTLATFIKRLNRFEAIIKIDQTEHLCHVPNTGRLRELLLEGALVYVQHFDNPKRKTKYKLILVEKEGTLVSIDSAGVPNKVVHEALLAEQFDEFEGYEKVSKEVTYSESRFDFFLTSHHESCFIEVKGVTLVNEGIAMFPDAPTERGSKHLDELIKAKHEGLRAAVIFLIQRKDADYFTPNDEIDKKFGKKLREAVEDGVEVYAFACEVSVEGAEVVKRVEVKL